MQQLEVEEDIDLWDYAATVLRYWWLIVGACTVAVLSAYVMTKSQKPGYEATSLVLVQPSDISPTLLQTMAQMVTVISEQDVTDKDGVDAKVVGNTSLIQVSVQGKDPERATDLSNKMAERFTAQVGQMINLLKETENGPVTVSTSIVQPAVVSNIPAGQKLTRNIAMAAILGLLFSVMGVFLLESFKSYRERVSTAKGTPTAITDLDRPSPRSVGIHSAPQDGD